MGPILVVSVAKRGLFRPLCKWMGGLFLVRNRVSFSDKSSSHQSWARKAGLKLYLYWLSGQNQWIVYIVEQMSEKVMQSGPG